jgi:hypothetical protein
MQSAARARHAVPRRSDCGELLDSQFAAPYAGFVPKTQSKIDVGGLPWQVTITWSVAREPVPIGIEVRALRGSEYRRGEINARLWRNFPIGQVIAEQRPQPAPAEAHDSDAEHYAAVAATYRAAVESGKPPSKAVAERFEVNASTARRWIYVARNRYHLLPKVRQGQIG